MDRKKAYLIVDAIDGWKTIIGAVGTPIATLIMTVSPPHTLASRSAFYFTILFGTTGILGVMDKYRKGQLPNQLRSLPEGVR